MTFESRTAGKKERRSLKDKVKSDKLKGLRSKEPKGPKPKKAPMTPTQKKHEEEMRQKQLDSGAFGLPGAGRGGKHETGRQKAERPDRKQKHKKRDIEAAVAKVASAFLAAQAAPVAEKTAGEFGFPPNVTMLIAIERLKYEFLRTLADEIHDNLEPGKWVLNARPKSMSLLAGNELYITFQFADTEYELIVNVAGNRFTVPTTSIRGTAKAILRQAEKWIY